jgi:nucleoside 2-deoxyribosyltransferase
MKIYFAGPLFTPYVRDFISQHAAILRQKGIEVFVPHENFLKLITPQKVKELVEQGLVTIEEAGDGNDPERIMSLVRAGRLTREQVGLPPATAKVIYDADYEGLSTANAVLALLDGTQIDDGTACELGIFYGLKLSDKSKKGIVGFMTDSRGTRKKADNWGLNLFALGVLEEIGVIYEDFADVLAKLLAWDAELKQG